VEKSLQDSGPRRSDWSEFLQRGADPDNPIQEHVFYVPRPRDECAEKEKKEEKEEKETAAAAAEEEDEKIVVKVRAGKAEEEFYETGQVRWFCVSRAS
jgi:hypothetical protein